MKEADTVREGPFMTTPHPSPVLRYLRRLTHRRTDGDGTDGQLLERFLQARDEAAFEALLRRHGPMVWGVCRRLLPHAPDAEDAFQATFLVLVRKAGSLRRRDLVGNWLYGVACRTAARARTEAAQRRAREGPRVDVPAAESLGDLLWRDLRPVLDEEVRRLPEKYRTAFILCYLEGQTNEQAARRLGCPKGTVLSRLAWARARLRQRLTPRGLALSAATLTAILAEGAAPAAAPAALAASTTKAALTCAAGKAALAGVVSAPAAALTEGVLHAMFLAKARVITAVVVALTVLGTGAGVATYRGRAAEGTSATTLVAQKSAEAGEEDTGKPKESRAERFAQRELEEAEKELLQLKSQLRIARVELEQLQAKEKALAEAPITEAVIEEAMIKDPIISRELAKIAELGEAITIATERSPRGGDEPEVKKLQDRIDKSRQIVEKRRKEIRPAAVKDYVSTARAGFQQRIAPLRERVDTLKALERVLEAEVARLEEKTRPAPKKSVEERLSNLEKEMRELKAAIEGLKKKK